MAADGVSFQKRARHDRHRRPEAQRDDDFDDRWGDQEASEEEQDPVDEADNGFAEPNVKRRKLSNGHAAAAAARRSSSPAKVKETEEEKDRRERDEFAKRLADR